MFNVATDPEHRHRGHARLCMTALIDWFRRSGVTVVDLRATGEAEPLYRQLGFLVPEAAGMQLHLPRG